MRYVPFDRKNAPNHWFYVAFFLVLAIAYGLANPPISMPRTATASDACYMAQKFVKSDLKAPTTASFAPCIAPHTLVTQTKRIWHVRSYVDAQNGFGAMLRNHFRADLIFYPATDSWTLTSLTFDAP
jgi:hypothetical protein